MSEAKTDLRVLRTRKLIMDSFINLSGQKEFRDITVKDITEEAMINRATFYYHFEDIHDLLEKALSEVLLINLSADQFDGRTLDEQSITDMFLAITEFQQSLSNRCHRGYEETIARIIREQLETVIFQLLANGQEEKDFKEQGLKILSNMRAWGLYGASDQWKKYHFDEKPEGYIQSVIPYLVKLVKE